MMIDTEALPINDAWLYPKEDKSDFEVNALSYSPLGLLLAIGNGLGLGDYDDGFYNYNNIWWRKTVTARN